MELVVLGSSSTGNGYLLRSSSGESIVIEAGIGIKKIKEATGFDLSQIRAVLISHSHNDHAGRTYEYLRAGLACYTSPEAEQEILRSQQGKLNECGFKNEQGTQGLKIYHHNMNCLSPKTQHYSGGFVFVAFDLVHDVKCYGYLIKHPEMGQAVFITDTLFCPYKFRGLNHIIIEANYSQEILDNNLERGEIIQKVRERVISSHMSFETCREFIKENDLRDVSNIILIHLSSTNSDAKAFTREINQMTWKKVFVAEAGLRVPLNKHPF